MADNINIKFEADGSSYRKSLQELTQESKTLASELKLVKSSFDDSTTSQEKGAKIAEVVQKQIEAQEKKVALLKAEYDRLSASEDANSTELQKQQEKINKAETALNQMNAELSEAQKMADGYADETAEAAKQTDKMDETARMLAASKLAEFYEAVGEAVQKVATASYDAAKELDEGYDTIIRKTGATGDTLGSLQETADRVFGKMPSDMADVGTAIGDLNTRFGMTGDELEGATELFLKFADITETDVSTAVNTTARLLKTYGGEIKDADKLLGYFAKQSQQTGVDTNTLLSSLDRNGSTLREMGLSLQESTKLLAMFEANGVDASGAMTGMRKAVLNGAKAGKSFDQVMAEATKKIKNAATDTEALEIATELFGTRGAVVMADGLRSGRISLRDLSESMETYGDVVGETFEATLDPWDKAKVAMNNLKIAGSELAGEALAAIAPLLEKVVGWIQGAVKWFKELPEPVKRVVAVIGMLVAGVGVAGPKIASLIQTLSMFKAANAVKALTAVSDGATAAAGSAGKFGGAMSLLTNPVTIAVGAVSAVGIALAAFVKASHDAIEAEHGLTDAQKATIATIKAENDAYNEMVSARESAVADVQAEFGYITKLKDEYNSLVDSNGKVKKGYEDRAQFILGELANATGMTIEQIQSEIDANGRLGSSIDAIIEKKKAEALLTVFQEDYATAIKNSASAYENYQAALDMVAEREQHLREVQADNSQINAQIEAYDRQIEQLKAMGQDYSGVAQARDEYLLGVQDQIDAERVAEKALEESREALRDSEETYEGYQSTIAKYEGMSAAIISGDEKKIAKATRAMSGDFTAAEKAQKASLEKMVSDQEVNLAKIERLYKSGRATKAMVTEARNAVTSARAELSAFYGVGSDAGTGLVNGIRSKKNAIAQEGRETGVQLVTSVADGAETRSPSKATMRTGSDVGQGLINGINEKKTSVKDAGKGIGTAAVDGTVDGISQNGKLKTAAKSIGETTTSSMAEGMRSKVGTVTSAAEGVAKETKKMMVPSYSWGVDVGGSYGAGIGSKKSAVAGAASGIADAAAGIKSNNSKAYDWGAELGEMYKRGMESKNEGIKRMSIKLANAASSAIHFTLPDIGPLRNIEKWGQELADKYAEGMMSSQSLRAMTAASTALAGVVQPELTFGPQGANGAPVSNTYRGGDVAITINAQDGQSAREIAHEVERIISTQYTRERMAWA